MSHKLSKELIVFAKKRGLKVEMRGSGHYAAVHPDSGRHVIFGATISDMRGQRNAEAAMKRLLREDNA